MNVISVNDSWFFCNCTDVIAITSTNHIHLKPFLHIKPHMPVISKSLTDNINIETPTNSSTQTSHTGSRISTSTGSSLAEQSIEEVQVPRRSNRTIKQPDWFGEWTTWFLVWEWTIGFNHYFPWERRCRIMYLLFDPLFFIINALYFVIGHGRLY